MFGKKKILAIIPARGGSKGIPNKNIRLINKKPMLAHTIISASLSKYIDYIFVSTDSVKIKNIAVKYGANVPFLRKKEYALDTSKTIDAVLYSIDELKKRNIFFDVLVLLQPTSPLRNEKDIDGAIELFFKSNTNVASVNQIEINPFLIRTIDSNFCLSQIIKSTSTIRRQDVPMYFKVNGAIYINDINSLTTETSFNDNETGYVMSLSDSIDIDTLDNLNMARKAFNK